MLDDPTFAWRAPIGVALLALLAARDRVRSGTWDRARELAFLFATTGLAMLWALAHDAVTWSVCRDYFVIGKGLPAAATSFAPVARLALFAGWSAGLAIGLVLVVANNPLPGRARLGYRALAIELVPVALASAAVALACALVLPFVVDAGMLDQAGVRDTRAYLAAQGAHLGSYVGAALGLVGAWRRVRRARR